MRAGKWYRRTPAVVFVVEMGEDYGSSSVKWVGVFATLLGATEAFQRDRWDHIGDGIVRSRDGFGWYTTITTTRVRP